MVEVYCPVTKRRYGSYFYPDGKGGAKMENERREGPGPDTTADGTQAENQQTEIGTQAPTEGAGEEAGDGSTAP